MSATLLCSGPGLSSESASLSADPGERIYREGVLPDGSPVMAVVQGDIPVDGRMFTCINCHQRSGLGSVEGTIITWPTTGRELYRPRRRIQAFRPPAPGKEATQRRRSIPPQFQSPDARPAYSDESLAAALRGGHDPAGRKIDYTMPRYLMEEKDMILLTNYLKVLSSDYSPGVDERFIRFATVVGPEVDKARSEAMIAVLRAYIDAHNSQNRHQERRAASGPFYHTEKNVAYRRLVLDVWELEGPPDSWRGQLEEAYAAGPVFALLGGIAEESWAPVHHFCEENRIPCLFPLTEKPVVSPSDWYTLYFSRGPRQEGEAAARFLRRMPERSEESRILQLHSPSGRGALIAEGTLLMLERLGRPLPESLSTGADPVLTDDLRRRIRKSDIVISWVDDGGPGFLEDLLRETSGSVVTSWTIHGEEAAALPEELRSRVYFTYPVSLPDERPRRVTALGAWLRARNIPAVDIDLQSRMYFLGWMLRGALKYMRSEFYRDYLMEGIDMMDDQDYAIVPYPRLSFGPGQRYASKGCYIVQLQPGPDPVPLPKSEWVVH